MNKLVLIHVGEKIAIFQKNITVRGFQGLTERVDAEEVGKTPSIELANT